MTVTIQKPPANAGQPSWEIAELFPRQGQWSEGDYLRLEDAGHRLIELSDGFIEVLDMPTLAHQNILVSLLDSVRGHAKAIGRGKAVQAPYPLRIGESKFREPDILFAFDRARFGPRFATGADLVIEIVSRDRDRDFATKRTEYANAGIPEYWIVDPQNETILVLTLVAGSYGVLGEFRGGQKATSKVLDGFSVSVSDVFAAATE